MPATAAYIAIQDSSRVLDHNSDIDHTFARFDAPDVNVNRRPILSFRVDPRGDVSLQMTLNGTVVLGETFLSGAPQSSLQEIVEPNILQAEDNELIATLTDNDNEGRVTLSAVTLLYTNVLS